MFTNLETKVFTVVYAMAVVVLVLDFAWWRIWWVNPLHGQTNAGFYWFLLVKVLAERPSGEVSLEVVDEMVEYFTGELKY